MPAQDRRRGDRKHFGPPAAVNQSRQRRKPEPIGVTPPRPATELTAQHLILVTEHQQLNVLRQISADPRRQQAEQAPHRQVDQRQQHPAMVAAAALIAQQNPSSQYETVFPSGTRSGSGRDALACAPHRAHRGSTVISFQPGRSK
jgi:hypothetical protein